MEVIPTPELALALVFPFLVTLAALHLILFKPLLAYLAGREHEVQHARHEAHRLTSEVEKRVADLSRRLTDAEKQVGELRAQGRGRAAHQEAAITGAARKAAESRTSDAILEIRDEKQRAAQRMRELASSLATDIAGRVLGRPTSAQ